eukprot:TRINITY_DN100479_c0_g1_i1.p2 TRINITY_DN100479_c0_g1~~TRINITY_DN100479_c0_g1_i1.p2  ORF type:complete len:160 (-),score=19.11 TRINITY_DN100479_c0_g1_i1:339-818(-)
MYQKLLATRTYRAATEMLRQLYYSSSDLELHTNFLLEGTQNIFEVDRKVSERFLVQPSYPGDRFLCSFVHVFGQDGDYAAGYYSYTWAEVMSVDAYDTFEQVGSGEEDKIESLGRRFRNTVLAIGGGKPAAEAFRNFQGRDPSINAMLKQKGLKTEVTA